MMHPVLTAVVLLQVMVHLAYPAGAIADSTRRQQEQNKLKQQQQMKQNMQGTASLITPRPTLLNMRLSTGQDTGGCFERIAIGRRLADVTVSTPLSVLSECEMKCFRSPDCRAFSFGMGRYGNGTCEMQHGTAADRMARRQGRKPRRLEPTQQPEDPDYDLFERRPDCETPSTTQQPPDRGDREPAPPPLLLQEIGPGGDPPGREPEVMLACFRILFSGRRLAERHIRRSLPAASAFECETACQREQQFFCEGFNFREDRRRVGRGSCELSALPQGEVGPALLRDFIEDRDYDFYERRRGAPPECASSFSGNREPPRDSDRFPQRPGGSPHHPYPGPAGGRPPGNWNSGPPYGSQSSRPPPPYGPQGSRLPPRDGPQGPPYGGPPNRPPPGPYQQGPRPSGPPVASWSPSAVGFYGPASPDFGPSPVGNFGPRPGGGYGQGRPGPVGNREIGGYGQPPGGFGKPPFPDDDECFSRVWSGQRLEDVMVRAASSPPTLGGCQLECLHARDFTCRSFSFRYGPSRGPGDVTCLLTDRPLRDLHPRNGLVTDPEFEFYERSSFVQGCEHLNQYPSSLPWHLQVSYHEENNQLPPLLAKPLPPRLHETESDYACYAEYWPSARLTATSVTVATHAPTIDDCLSRCTDSIRLWKSPCRSLSYKGGVHGHNCLLSELAQRDLRPNRDFVHETGGETQGWRLMAWDWADPRCREPPQRPGGTGVVPWNPNRDKTESPWSGSGGTFGIYAGSSNSAGSGGGYYGGNSGSFGSSSGSHGIGSGSGGGGSYGGTSGSSSWSNSGGSSSYGGGSSGNPGPWKGGGSGNSFTVSGKPCVRGHVCQINQAGGFWSCPINDSNGKEWDYCCSPTHRCGYSEGMQKPWCYVGHSKDQWRPCSERYWPYSSNDNDNDDRSYRREGRLLPVAFLHKSGPPGNEINEDRLHSNKLRSLRPWNSSNNNTRNNNYWNSTDSADLIPISLSVVDTKDP